MFVCVDAMVGSGGYGGDDGDGSLLVAVVWITEMLEGGAGGGERLC